jgi:hypothetical protein
MADQLSSRRGLCDDDTQCFRRHVRWLFYQMALIKIVIEPVGRERRFKVIGVDSYSRLPGSPAGLREESHADAHHTFRKGIANQSFCRESTSQGITN